MQVHKESCICTVDFGERSGFTDLKIQTLEEITNQVPQVIQEIFSSAGFPGGILFETFIQKTLAAGLVQVLLHPGVTKISVHYVIVHILLLWFFLNLCTKFNQAALFNRQIYVQKGQICIICLIMV